MKEQTAMQELIERLKKTNQEYYAKWKAAKGNDKKQWNDAMSVQTIAVMNAEKLLTKEREQIEQAWQDGYATGCSVGGNDYTTETENDTGANFFTTTYKQPL